MGERVPRRARGAVNPEAYLNSTSRERERRLAHRVFEKSIGMSNYPRAAGPFLCGRVSASRS